MQDNHRGHEYLACFRKQEVETQIHTDQKGCTRMARSHRMWANVGSARTVHRRASLLIRVHLCFPFLREIIKPVSGQSTTGRNFVVAYGGSRG